MSDEQQAMGKVEGPSDGPSGLPPVERESNGAVTSEDDQVAILDALQEQHGLADDPE